MRRFTLGLGIVFWLAVAALPMVLDQQVTDFMLERNCMPGTECLRLAMPLIAQVEVVAWGARMLLWPVAIWNLGGRWLWRQARARRVLIRTAESASGGSDA
jgi:hypothetical protein